MSLLAAGLAGLAALLAVGLPRAGPWRRPPPAVLAVPAGLLLLLPLGPAAAVAGGLVGAAALLGTRQREAARAHAAERAGAVEAVTVLAAELRAGRSPGDALAAAAGVAEGPAGAAFGAASRAVLAGADPVPVLHASAPTSAAGPALVGLAACLQVCAGSGSSLAGATDTVAAALRADEEQRLAVAAELAGPRATAVMLAGLPLVGTALAGALGARPVHVLLHTTVGGCCLVGGVLLDLAGLWWTDRLVRRAQS